MLPVKSPYKTKEGWYNCDACQCFPFKGCLKANLAQVFHSVIVSVRLVIESLLVI